MKNFLKVMKALSDPNRVSIIKMLQIKTMCVCEIREALGLAQSTVSQHMKVLENAGIVKSYKDGLWVNYSISDKNSDEITQVMMHHLEEWLNGEPEIVNLRKRLPGINRETIVKK